jgi:hypothetical protein
MGMCGDSNQKQKGRANRPVTSSGDRSFLLTSCDLLPKDYKRKGIALDK